MPYTDIQNQNYDDILYIFTTSIINGRFDILNTDNKNSEDKYQTQDTGLHSLFFDFQKNFEKDPEKITKEKYFYTSYGTYRRDITGDLDIVKKSETLVNNIDYNNAYYNITNYKYDTTPDNIFDNRYALNRLYNFKGIALNYSYPCNGHAASLEDIFAEYGYDYIVAQEQQRFQNAEPYYYFQETQSYNTQFTYEILPIGTIYTDEETGEVITVEYDGTTVPTASQIISGNLYIAIKSGNMPIRRIYFNNQYMPTLFVNDDKYDLHLTMQDKYSETSYQYVLNNNQIMKLCDVTRYKSYGYYLTFTNTFLIYANNDNKQPFGGTWILPTGDDENNYLYTYGSNGSDQIINSIKIEKNISDKTTLSDFSFGISFRVFAILYTHDIDKIRWVEGTDYTTDENKQNELLGKSYTYELSLCRIRQEYEIKTEGTLTNIIKSNQLYTEYDEKNKYYINDSNYIFNNKSTSSISEPRTPIETTDLLVCVVPCIYFDDFILTNIEDHLQPSPDSSNKTITLSYSSGSTAEIWLTPSSITNNIKNGLYKFGNNYQNILGYSSIDENDTEIDRVTTSDSIDDLSTNITKPSLTISKSYQVEGKKSICYGISDIHFKELTEYKLSNNIIEYELADLNLDITLSGKKLTCGFFTDNTDYDPVFMEEVEYEPVFLEWVDDYEPVFIVLD